MKFEGSGISPKSHILQKFNSNLPSEDDVIANIQLPYSTVTIFL